MDQGKKIKVDPTEIVLRNIVKEFGVGGYATKIYDNSIMGINGIKNFIESIELKIKDHKRFYRITFENFVLKKPMDSEGSVDVNLTPAKARREFKNYFGSSSATLVMEERKIYKDGSMSEPKEERELNINFGSIPVMLKSKFCHLSGKTDEELMLMGEKKNDPGCYYLSKGKSKIIEMQDMLGHDREIMSTSNKKKKDPISIMYIPTHRNIKVIQLSKGKLNNIKISLKSLSKKNKQKSIENNKYTKNSSKGSIDIFHIINILGYTLKETTDMISILLGEKNKKKRDCLRAFEATILASNPITDESISYVKFAIKSLLKLKDRTIQHSTEFSKLLEEYEDNKYLRRDMRKKVNKLIDDELFPNINSMFEDEEVNKQKFLMICMMLTNYLQYITGYKSIDDKNNWQIKKLQLSPDHIKQLFKIVINHMFFIDDIYGRGKKPKNGDKKSSSICIKSKLKNKLESNKKITLSNVVELLKPISGKITDVFQQSLGGTSWGYQKFKKLNIVQHLPVNNSFLLMSYISKITVESSKYNGIEERKYQLSSVGSVCVGANPDNENCGLNRDQAIISMVSCESDIMDVKRDLDKVGINIRRLNRAKRYFSEGRDEDAINTIFSLDNFDTDIHRIRKSIKNENYDIEEIKEIINNKELKDVSIDYEFDSEKTGKIFLNGIFVGFVNLLETFEYLVELKKQKYRHASITYDQESCLRVYTTECRPLRLFYTIDKYTCRLNIDKDDKWNLPIKTLISEGYLIYLDTMETSFYYISPDYESIENYREKLNNLQKRYKENKEKYEREYFEAIFNQYEYCEISKNIVFGYIGTTIPLANRMPLIRASYAIKHKVQALTNVNIDITEESNKITLTQDPQVATFMDWELANQNPVGNQVLTAINVEGDNKEDALLINRASLQNKGLFAYIKIYIKSTTVNEDIGEKLGNPNILIEEGKKINKFNRKFSHIGDDGLPKIGSILKENDCVICKFILNSKKGGGKEYKFSGEYMKAGETGIVIGVKVIEITQSRKEIMIKLKDYRTAQVGDKFAYPFAQKFTIGKIIDPEDMPFTENGETPDVIVSPFIFLNRSTAGMVLIGLIGVAAALEGKHYNVSSFKKIDEEYFMNILTKYGRNRFGLVNMYNPYDGTLIENPINLAVLQLNQLDRNSIDIIQARAGGGVKDPKTQQAVKTKMGGGIKTGWMERQLYISHGAYGLLMEKMLLNADPYVYKVCKRCSLSAEYQRSTRKFICNKCGKKAQIGKKVGPFADGLIRDLLLPLGILYKSRYVDEEEYSQYIYERFGK